MGGCKILINTLKALLFENLKTTNLSLLTRYLRLTLQQQFRAFFLKPERME